MKASSPFLKVDHLSKQVSSGNSQITILRDVNFSLAKGASLAILGASGSGKTTLLTLLAGLDLPSSGNIFLQDFRVNHLSEEQRAAMRAKFVGFIFQSFQLLNAFSVLENVMLPLEIKRIPYRKAKELAAIWLERVGLGERLYHYPSTLSGGEQQRVAIARAFVTEPNIIFADEMTGNLDNATGQQVSDVLFELNQKQGTTLVLVTHDAQLAERCQHRMQLHHGVLTPC